MNRLVLVAPLLATCLLPPPAGAQTAAPDPSAGPAYAPIELTAADLGTWDVVLTGRSPSGTRVTVRGVETNTVGCDGRCILTRAEGELAKATARRNGGSASWWRAYDSPGDFSLKQTGLPQSVANPSTAIDARGTVPPPPATPGAATGSQPSRTSVEYDGTDRRVVAVYRPDGQGRDVLVTRIVYTRRR
jgi:hypothetical protein